MKFDFFGLKKHEEVVKEGWIPLEKLSSFFSGEICWIEDSDDTEAHNHVEFYVVSVRRKAVLLSRNPLKRKGYAILSYNTADTGWKLVLGKPWYGHCCVWKPIQLENLFERPIV